MARPFANRVSTLLDTLTLEDLHDPVINLDRFARSAHRMWLQQDVTRIEPVDMDMQDPANPLNFLRVSPPPSRC
jgi:kynurenine formamidase